MTKKRMTTAQLKAEIDQRMGMFEGMEQVHSKVLKQTRAEMYELRGELTTLKAAIKFREENVDRTIEAHWDVVSRHRDNIEQLRGDIKELKASAKAEHQKYLDMEDRVCKLEDRTSRRTEAVKDFLARHWLLLIPLAGFGTVAVMLNHYVPTYVPLLAGISSFIVGFVGLGVWASKNFD